MRISTYREIPRKLDDAKFFHFLVVCLDNPIKKALGVIARKGAKKKEVLVIFCVFSEIGIHYFDSIIIHLGLLIDRSVANLKTEALL